MNDTSKFVSAQEAARLLDLSSVRVRQFCEDGRLAALKISGVWVIDAVDLQRFRKLRRRPGRPGRRS